jgi:hypothetical protein
MKNRFKNFGCWLGQGGGCPTGSAEARQISLFGLAQETSAAIGCPIDFQQAAQFPVLPAGRADQSEEAGEAVMPLSQPGAEAQPDIGQQRRPDLPFDGTLAVAQEVGQLEGLFEFLEEGFDAPAAAIQIGDGLGAPFQMVGQENHFAELAVHFHERRDAAQFHRIVFGGWASQRDEIVAQNVATSSVLKFSGDAGREVVLGTRDPKDAALGQVGQMGEVEASLVEDGDFTRLNTGAKLAGPAVVMLGGGIHDGAAGQKTLEIEPDMAFGGGFATAVFGPVQRACHQLDGGGVHHMNEPLETEGEPGRAVAAKGGLQRFQMFQHRPEQLFGHLGIAGAIGVSERVLGRWRRAAQRRQGTRMQAQRIAHIVETQAVRQLGIKQAHDVTPRCERAGMIFNPCVARQFGNQMRRNEVAKLAQQRELAGRWLTLSLVFHALPCGRVQTGKPTFFISKTSTPVSQQCIFFISSYWMTGRVSA